MKSNVEQTKITKFFKRISNNTKADVNQTKITDFFKKKIVYGYCNKTGSWHCLICGANMGPNNPRQICGKSYCHNPPLILDDEDIVPQNSNKRQRDNSSFNPDYEINDSSDDDK